MERLKRTFLLLLFTVGMITISMAQDWPDLNHYREENNNLMKVEPNYNRVVFMGNSIIEGWIKQRPEFFAGKFYLNRGISGQTTPQMLLRFRADVINLKPKAVLILAGTNDIAGNTGPSTLEMIEDNIISMVQLAKANDIKVILCSVLPVYDYPWKPGIQPAEKIVELNKMIQSYAAKNGIYYLDFFSAMVNDHNGLKSDYSVDGVHPNDAGYKVMEPLTEAAISKVLALASPVVHTSHPVHHTTHHTTHTIHTTPAKTTTTKK